MSYENSAGLNVHNHYGPRDTGGAVGGETRLGSEVQLRIDLTGRSIVDFLAGFVPPVNIPEGAKMVSYTLRVDEAFDTTGDLVVGAATAPATNGVTITTAELAAVGTKVVTDTGDGTWDITGTGTTEADFVGFAGGIVVDDPTVGKGTLVIKYLDVAKV